MLLVLSHRYLSSWDPVQVRFTILHYTHSIKKIEFIEWYTHLSMMFVDTCMYNIDLIRFEKSQIVVSHELVILCHHEYLIYNNTFFVINTINKP